MISCDWCSENYIDELDTYECEECGSEFYACDVCMEYHCIELVKCKNCSNWE